MRWTERRRGARVCTVLDGYVVDVGGVQYFARSGGVIRPKKFC